MARRISDPGLRFYTRFGCLPAATAAEQIDRGTQLKQGIIGRLDSVHAGDGIEDDLLLLMRIVWDRIRKNDLSKIDQRSLLGPVKRCVVDDIVIVCHLDLKLKADRASRDSRCDLVKKEVCLLAFGGGFIQMVVPSVGRDSVAPVAARPILISEAHRGHTEIRFSGEAGRTRLGRQHEF